MKHSRSDIESRNLCAEMPSLEISVRLLLLVSVLVCLRPTLANRYLRTDRKDCTEAEFRKVDQMITYLTSSGVEGRQYPEKMSDLKDFCAETAHHVAFIDSFIRRCYLPEVRDVAKVVVYSVKNTIKTYCKKRKSKKLLTLLGVAPCINKELHNKNTCIKKFATQVHELQFIENDKVKIPHTCCRFVEAIRCAENALETVPCAKGQSHLIMDFIAGLYTNMVNFMCGDYTDESNKCDELGPQPVVSAKSVKAKKQYLSPLFPLIDLLQSMKQLEVST